MTKLFLDDTRQPPNNEWVVVRSYDAFVSYITEFGMPDLISFDHDLGFEHYITSCEEPMPKDIPYDTYLEKTGYDCAKWIVENGYKLNDWVVHSMNPVGKDNIIKLLVAYEIRCHVPTTGG